MIGSFSPMVSYGMMPVSAPINQATSANQPASGGAAIPAAQFPPTWQSKGVQKQETTSPFGYPLTLYTLPNGHRIMVEQRPTDVVSLRTYINTGSILENGIVPSPWYRNIGLPSGIAHLDEHCHFLSTEHFPAKNNWKRVLDQYGVYANAHTSHESIDHEITFNREDLEPILKLHSEMVLHPLYTGDIQQEKNAVINEMARNNRVPNTKLYSETCRLLFDRPFTQIGGSTPDVMGTTPEQMRQFYNLAYAPTNMMTVISGKVNPEAVLTILAPEFGANPPRNLGLGNQGLRVVLGPNEIRTATIIDPQLTNSKVSIGFPAPPSNNYQERMAMKFLDEILCSDDLSMLRDQVVNRQQAATSASSSYDDFKQSGMLNITLNMPAGQEQRALTGTLNAVSQLSQGLVPDQTVAQIRQRLVQRFLQDRSDLQAGTRLLGEEGVKNTLLFYQQYVQLANLVSAEDIQAMARKYLNPNRYVVVFGLPKAPSPSAYSTYPAQGGLR